MSNTQYLVNVSDKKWSLLLFCHSKCGLFWPILRSKNTRNKVAATANLLVYYEQEFCYVYVFYFIYPRVTFLFVGGG